MTDEKLEVFFIIKSAQQHKRRSLSPSDHNPPPSLLTFFNHLQITLDAIYIPPTPTVSIPNPRLSVIPPRSSSAATTPTSKGLGIPFPTAPPQTPSPKPITSDNDKQYAFAEGAVLKSFVWGDNEEDREDGFRLLWSKGDKCWIAFYKLSLTVGKLIHYSKERPY